LEADIGISLNNLGRLGLLEQRSEYPGLPENDDIVKNLTLEYEQTRQSLDQESTRQQLGIAEGGRVELFVIINGLYLNPLGFNFARICLR
jgi:hypothetical protein